jgi:phosphomevalonate kinase
MSDPALGFSAPGKMVIAGEYSVLEGSPAVVVGVDRRARCRVEESEVLEIQGMGRGPYPVKADGGTIQIVGDEDDALSVARFVFQEALERGLSLPKGRVVVDSTELFVDVGGVGTSGEKLGLGSSAAVAACMSAMHIVHAGATMFPEKVFHLALAAHRRFSGGHGSGVDVVAACYGGMRRFEPRPDDPTLPRAFKMSGFPSDVTVVPAWAGRGQNTRTYLKAVAALKDKDPARYEKAMGALSEASAKMIDALEKTRAGSDGQRAIFDAVDACRMAMARLGVVAGIDVVSASHRRIAEIAAENGGAAKPSGAGGGDIALCFVPGYRVGGVKATLQGEGFIPLDLGLSTSGVKVEMTG